MVFKPHWCFLEQMLAMLRYPMRSSRKRSVEPSLQPPTPPAPSPSPQPEPSRARPARPAQPGQPSPQPRPAQASPSTLPSAQPQMQNVVPKKKVSRKTFRPKRFTQNVSPKTFRPKLSPKTLLAPKPLTISTLLRPVQNPKKIGVRHGV